MRLEGKTAIVTGAGSGIGRGVARRFNQEGARLVLADWSEEGLQATVNEINDVGGQAIGVTADVSKKADVEALVAAAVQTYGGLDIMVNNAGVASWASVLDQTEEEWDRMIAVNLKGVFLGIQAAAKQMVSQGTKGKIVNTASVNSMVISENQTAYAASKGGVYMLTRAAAADLAKYGINVNCIAPGGTRTNIDPRLQSPTIDERTKKTVPLGRVAEPLDQANGVVFLSSDEADYITGHMLVIDGGMTMRQYSGQDQSDWD